MADGMVENLEVAVPQHFEETGITLRLVRRYMVDALVVPVRHLSTPNPTPSSLAAAIWESESYPLNVPD